MKIIAEWIETEEDAELLRSWGIDYLQGHLLGLASIVPPWTREIEATFSLESPTEVAAETPALIDQVQPIPQDVEPISDLESIANLDQDFVQLEIPPESEPAVAAKPPENKTHIELDFSGIDESIFALKQTLESLRIETEASDSQRSAA